MEINSQRAKTLKALGILIAVLGVGTVCVALSPLGKVISSMFAATQARHSLKDRSDALEIGVAMASCIGDPSFAGDPLILSKDKRMPPRLRELNPKYLRVDTEQKTASLEFGGGFNHYGYLIVADGPRGYRMKFYGENDEDIVELGAFQITEGGR